MSSMLRMMIIVMVNGKLICWCSVLLLLLLFVCAARVIFCVEFFLVMRFICYRILSLDQICSGIVFRGW